MKELRKIRQWNMDLFLPLAAVLIGILIMVLQSPITVQAMMAVPMPHSFKGEYSYDNVNWHPLEEETDLSARNRDLYLRGHFENEIPPDCRLYYFSDHIASSLHINGQLQELDVILEVEEYGIPVQPSMCSRTWKYFYFAEGLPTDALVEIHLKNPHSYGNKDAYEYFLQTLTGTPNDQELLSMNLAPYSKLFNGLGLSFAIVGAMLLCAALVILFLRLPLDISVVQTGLLAVAAGGCFLLDTVDLVFRSDDNIVNTYGWQLCIMYSVYLLGIMARDLLEGRRRQVAIAVMTLCASFDIVLILLSFSGVVLIYDTLHSWVLLQVVCSPVLLLCCAWELFAGKRKKQADLLVFILIFACILMDCVGFTNSIYSRSLMTKSGFVLLFLLKLIQFLGKILANFKASTRAVKLEKELEESRITLMLSQIQPHFIFNVLGTIRALCRQDPEWAWRALGDFSDYLRANMNALTNANFIPFERELSHIEAYLRLEQMRMGERLNVVYDIQEKAFFIPPLILQPLVENAVKHGIFYKEGEGTVTIRSVRDDRTVILTVCDDGVGFEAAAKAEDYNQRQHHGLQNVRSRVEKMLGGTLAVESRADQGTTVTLEFPVVDHL